jgi:hypothetical protein
MKNMDICPAIRVKEGGEREEATALPIKGMAFWRKDGKS